MASQPAIGMLRESPLHAELKQALAAPEDRFEVPLEGFVIDLVRANGELVEIQTGSFWSLRDKLSRLLDFHPMRVVYPVTYPASWLKVFDELVSLPTLLSHPHFTLEVVVCREKRRRRDPSAPLRGRRRLVEMVARHELNSPQQLLELLPVDPFTTRTLALRLGCPLARAQRLVYCLRALDLIEERGVQSRCRLYERRRQR